MPTPNLPPAFVSRMQQMLGNDYPAFEASLSTSAPKSIRVNPHKWAATVPLARVHWATHGYTLPQPTTFTLDPLHHAGAYYVQEGSSMFLEQAFMQHAAQHTPTGSGLVVLDLCGAPGGKSTHLASLLPANSLLVSNEVVRSRAEVLAQNMVRWGHNQILVSNNDPADFARLPAVFDVMVVDAPCSGEGLFRKDASAVNEWSAGAVQLCAERQQRILADAWPALKPGGLLIYSTCTYNEQENEQNLAWLMNHGAESLPIAVQEDWGITPAYLSGAYGYRFYPHKVAGEGLFMAALRKTGQQGSKPKKVKQRQLTMASKAEAAAVASWLINPESYALIQHDTLLRAFPAAHLPLVARLYQQLKVTHGGTTIADVKKKNLNPHHQLALLAGCNTSAFDQLPLDGHTALTYLKKETFVADTTKNGWHLVTYHNIPLGWVKQIGPRLNNYFPTDWRIRMDIAPGPQQVLE